MDTGCWELHRTPNAEFGSFYQYPASSIQYTNIQDPAYQHHQYLNFKIYTLNNNFISLCELLNQVKSVISTYLPPSWWIVAEINELKSNYSGHCYLELIEKNDLDESIKAKVKATIWSSVYRMLRPYFETTTGTQLCQGIKVMIKVSAEFHELYGFSLNVTDIEPSFTVGELARQKQLFIKRLRDEGVFDMNKSMVIPDIPSRIAIVSSKTAAGHGDFIDQLINNKYGYGFQVKLFPSIMQGNDAENSIVSALEKIYKYESCFDAVVIIRGGGSQSDLNCFNSYWLNYNICQFPLPIITGIGHEQDETIADMVACKRLKTPTAVAEFLIDCFREFENLINERSSDLFNIISDKISDEKKRLADMFVSLKPVLKERLNRNNNDLKFKTLNLKNVSEQILIKQKNTLNTVKTGFHSALNSFIKNHNHHLELLEKKHNYLDPFLILKRGYSITYSKGRVLKDPSEVKHDEIIETRLAKGILKSKSL